MCHNDAPLLPSLPCRNSFHCPACAALTDAKDVEVCVDPRRAKAFRSLLRCLQSPLVTDPVARLGLHTWFVLAALLAVHVVCDVILTALVKQQHT